MARKKKIFENVEVIDIGNKGWSIGRRQNGEIVMVNGAVPGDVVDIECGRKRKGLHHGRVRHIHSFSENRSQPFCEHFEDCGGCKWQNLSYEAQVKFKENQVRQTIKRISQQEPETFLPILASEQDRLYRNKLEFTFANRRWLTVKEKDDDSADSNQPAVGFHPPGTYYKVLDIDTCHLQNEPTNAIRNWLRSYALEHEYPFYDINQHEGLFRNVVIRVFETGDVLVTMVFGDAHVDIPNILSDLYQAFPQITSLWYVINTKVNDSTHDLPAIHAHGNTFVTETLDHVSFKIGPKSFFQTNTRQAIRLYDVARSFANLQSEEVVYDLYCGLGSITLFVAEDCKEIIGIEAIEAAIEDAKANAEYNNISHAHFYAGDANRLIDPEILEKHGRPDVIITDPPRAGMSKEVVDGILDLLPERVVYISCNPSTQARDIALLSDVYKLEKIQPVDMFPQTSHIESVALLTKR